MQGKAGMEPELDFVRATGGKPLPTTGLCFFLAGCDSLSDGGEPGWRYEIANPNRCRKVRRG
jgi:hypothetical protein